MLILLGFASQQAAAQNTKGDRPEVKYGGKRESRFKLPRKKTKTKTPYNRVKSRRFSPASSGRVSRSTKSNKNIYANKRFVNSKTTSAKISRRNTRSGGGRVSARSVTSRTRNVYPQRGRYVNNRSTIKSRSSGEKAVSNRQQISRAKRFGTKQNPPNVRGRVTPASASRPFISRKSINPFAGFWNQKPKGEKAYTKGDLAGRKLRTKNFETKRPVLVNPTARPYTVRPKKFDRAYKGTMRSGYVSRSQSGKAWSGDIAGRKIKGRNYSSKKTTVAGKRIFPPRQTKRKSGDQAYKGSMPGGGYKSVSGRGRWNNNGRAIAGRNAGASGNMSGYSGNIKLFGRGKNYKPQGEDYTGNIKLFGRGKNYKVQGEDYTGNIKARRPLKGGGTIGRANWNNNGRAIAGRNAGANGNISGYSGTIKSFGGKNYKVQGEDYTGSIKARKPLKGGGSMSGSWNNKGRAIAGRYPGGDQKVSAFQGNLKFQRKQKGGGSVGRESWNNKGTAIAGRYPGGNQKISKYQGGLRLSDKLSMRNQGEEFTGTIKAKPKPKGGGSISGKLWNNNQQSNTVRNPNSTKMALYPGKQKLFDTHPSMRDQGEEFTGYIKLSRFKKNYVKNPNASEDALKKNRPDKTTYLVNGLQVKVKEKDYKERPNAAKGSMPGIGPGKNSIRASEYYKVMRLRWDYVRNPSSSESALKVREPGKAFARATDYQGNIKMKKFDLFGKREMYPDSRFVKTNKNNTDEERSLLTNFKLWWARLFKKNENQPDHLKEKIKKPRYDKGEQGLWYD